VLGRFTQWQPRVKGGHQARTDVGRGASGHRARRPHWHNIGRRSSSAGALCRAIDAPPQRGRRERAHVGSRSPAIQDSFTSRRRSNWPRAGLGDRGSNAIGIRFDGTYPPWSDQSVPVGASPASHFVHP
jgi:hypothetical protein